MLHLKARSLVLVLIVFYINVAAAIAAGPKFECRTRLTLPRLTLAKTFVSRLNATTFVDPATKNKLTVLAIDWSGYAEEVFRAVQKGKSRIRIDGLDFRIEHEFNSIVITDKNSKSIDFIGNSEFTLSEFKNKFKGRVSFGVRTTNRGLIGMGSIVFNEASNEVRVMRMDFDEDMRARGLGSAIFKLLRDTVPRDTVLSMTSANTPTRLRLDPISDEIMQSAAYKEIYAQQGAEAAMNYYRQEYARRALEISSATPDVVWVRVLNNSGWHLEAAEASNYGPRLKSRKHR
jgi:hypothetical protein